MKSTQYLHRPANGFNRLMKWPLACGLLTLALAHTVLAADAVYENDGLVSYPGTQSYPPVIDAIKFVNNGTFIINFTTLSSGTPPYYETSDTQNYTNTGTMMANTGFRFDNQSSSSVGARSNSASFFNTGLISGGSTNNTGDPFGGALPAQIFVNATNIINSGQIDVGQGGYIQIAGQNVDLSHGTLNMETASANNSSGSSYITGSGTFGLNTNNSTWSPTNYLTLNGATSSPPVSLTLVTNNLNTNIIKFFVHTNTITITDNSTYTNYNNITRAVFIQDNSSSGVTYYVRFDGTNDTATANLFGVNSGGVVVTWTGSYTNPADGSATTNFLYLHNDYQRAVNTNLTLQFNGIPDNFQFVQSTTKLLTDDKYYLTTNEFTDSYITNFTATSVTNQYSYADAQLVASQSSPNNIANGSVTNLPGRIELTAANEMNLTAVRILGGNYLSLNCPNQFDGTAAATIQSPYSDINLGVTNGFLAISNLITPALPKWSGTIQAWTTEWSEVDTNTGATNDIRVLLISSQLNPQSSSQVQDLKLHGTNTVIYDTFNIMRTFTSDAQNLTLTTNGSGLGFTSLDGELNLETNSIFWASSLPNLRNLTNNGAIRFQNLCQFIGTSNIFSVTPGTPAAAASGTLAEVAGRTNVLAGNRVQIGTNFYTFATALTNTLANQILIASKFDGTLSNLIAAINGAAGAGTRYSTNTKASGEVSAGLLINHAFTVTAITAGLAGTNIDTAVSVSTTNLVWTGSHLVGGADATPGSTNLVGTTAVPYDNFINKALLSDQGSTIQANNFVNSGVISNSALGSFSLRSQTVTLTNGIVQAGGDILITANSLVASNVTLLAGRSLTLSVTNLLTDTGVTNKNFWTVQNSNSPGGNGLKLLVKPVLGDLLGTTITNVLAGSNPQNYNVWAGQDYGTNLVGYTNNAALGCLVLDALGANSLFNFSGAGTSNALYVDTLVFKDYMTNGTNNNSYDFSTNLFINTNLTIYFGRAWVGTNNISSKVESASLSNKNSGGRLRWVRSYTFTNSLFTPHLVISPFKVAQPLLSSASGGASSSIQFTVSSDSAATNILEISTNLVTWIPIHTNIGSFTFTNRDASNYPVQFYRVVVP
jgi:hypothetical protein